MQWGPCFGALVLMKTSIKLQLQETKQIIKNKNGYLTVYHHYLSGILVQQHFCIVDAYLFAGFEHHIGSESQQAHLSVVR